MNHEAKPAREKEFWRALSKTGVGRRGSRPFSSVIVRLLTHDP